LLNYKRLGEMRAKYKESFCQGITMESKQDVLIISRGKLTALVNLTGKTLDIVNIIKEDIIFDIITQKTCNQVENNRAVVFKS